jgi:hypothetical protein
MKDCIYYLLYDCELAQMIITAVLFYAAVGAGVLLIRKALKQLKE